MLRLTSQKEVLQKGVFPNNIHSHAYNVCYRELRLQAGQQSNGPAPSSGALCC